MKAEYLAVRYDLTPHALIAGERKEEGVHSQSVPRVAYVPGIERDFKLKIGESVAARWAWR